MIHIPPSAVEFTLGKLQITRAASAAIKDSGESVWTFILRRPLYSDHHRASAPIFSSIVRRCSYSRRRCSRMAMIFGSSDPRIVHVFRVRPEAT